MSRKGSHAGTMRKGVLLAVILMFAGTTTALADDTTKFVPGTKINGVSVGGMTVEEAKIQIEGFYGREYRLSIKEKGEVTEVINGPDIGYQVVFAEGLKTVLEEQNASGRVTGPAADNTYSQKGAVSYDEGKLKEKLNSLSCISGEGIMATTNARISDWQQGVPFAILPEVQGNSVNLEKLEATVKAALNEVLPQINIEESGCYDTVTVTSMDTGLIAQRDALNRVREMEITYTLGDQSEVLKGEEICSWISGMTGEVINVRGDKTSAYIKALADKYDTVGKERAFRVTDGKARLLPGSYGQKIDQAGETAALAAIIQSGQSQKREPKYVQTVANRSNAWGGDYVEVDMAAQHVYMYKGGVLVWDSPCVTGNVSKKYTTPEGIYTLYNKETDRILRGKRQADGTYEYESHVNYWMPFNGGIGLHDANWRSRFGGDIYQTKGSHGCINLPPDKAKALYGLVYSGIPVICHY
ncbi:L,D-transpeptidase family protein [Lacrimispora celerecrescens]|uniref:Putative peptidoglycan binding protein n=1 Tax=[Clostridium] celerecrescens 18A TaxID=1286362 RepID=A0A2M8Z7F2_9FIRM|nr:L,D-transpeptidase family protein [Lacrimispora celerecrescens]PJJ29361.1 putative peptidoglycan binding protein [[Clostridium] celerecrescens 18A]